MAFQVNGKDMKMCAVFTTPIAAAAFPLFKSRKFQEPRKFFPRRLEFGGEFRCKSSVSWNVCRGKKRIMKGSNLVRASTSDEGVQALEQESLVGEESLAFRAGGIEATLNNLVGKISNNFADSVDLSFYMSLFLFILLCDNKLSYLNEEQRGSCICCKNYH